MRVAAESFRTFTQGLFPFFLSPRLTCRCFTFMDVCERWKEESWEDKAGGYDRLADKVSYQAGRIMNIHSFSDVAQENVVMYARTSTRRVAAPYASDQRCIYASNQVNPVKATKLCNAR